MTYIVSFGGGATSYLALRRTIEKHGRENTIAVFADVGQVRDHLDRVVSGEDDDLFRFMAEVEELLQFKITRLKHEHFKDIWDVFFKERMMGSSRLDPCSKHLKRGLLDAWIKARYTPENSIRVLGLDWTEPERVETYKKAIAPWPTYFPLCEQPFMTKASIVDSLRCDGIEPPNLYELGFSHNNCGGFCVKMGHNQAWRLWRALPHVYDHHEQQEQKFRAWIGKDVAILKDRRNKGTRPLTLKELRIRFENGYLPKRGPGEGCGGSCMTPEAVTPVPSES